MRWITKDIAAQMEACIKKIHTEVAQQYPKGKVLEINGGAACFSEIDSYLSHVVAWGFASQPRQFKAEIELIEQFYKTQNQCRIDIELCSLVENNLSQFLSERGYGITELNNVSVLDLATHEYTDVSVTPFELREVRSDELLIWARQVAIGFDYPQAKDQFFHYLRASGVKAFAVYDQGVIVAGATVAIQGAFCDLALTSTLLAYRGKGLQKKLVQARLHYAKKQGVSWAMVTTESGTVSDANIQKSGFGCVYTRIKMTKQ